MKSLVFWANKVTVFYLKPHFWEMHFDSFFISFIIYLLVQSHLEMVIYNRKKRRCNKHGYKMCMMKMGILSTFRKISEMINFNLYMLKHCVYDAQMRKKPHIFLPFLFFIIISLMSPSISVIYHLLFSQHYFGYL